GEGGGEPGADVLDPPQVLVVGDPQEPAVQAGVVVDLQGALAADVERLVPGDGEPPPAELQLDRGLLAHCLLPLTRRTPRPGRPTPVPARRSCPPRCTPGSRSRSSGAARRPADSPPPCCRRCGSTRS